MSESEDKPFIWTPKITAKFFKLRFENDWLFKKKKQPWHEFWRILQNHGFPNHMTVNHVRKKWSYTYDSYKIAKKTKNRRWKYYKIFDNHFGKSQVLDKYETWNDEWRLKLINCVSDAKALNLDLISMWREIECFLRSMNLPSDCCIQDIKGLWQYLRVIFNRKHRIKLKRGSTDWPLYGAMLAYHETHEPERLQRLGRLERCAGVPRAVRARRDRADDGDTGQGSEFIWTKDITESFIQIRLRNEWLFKEKKWAWHDFQKIMVKEYGFPKTLTNREICRKWNSTFSDWQKAVATNNTAWVYYRLFECYLGDGSFSLNPLAGWRDEWIMALIEARTDCEHWFAKRYEHKDFKERGWREVEKTLRSNGLPLDHSLFDLPEIWTHLLKTYRWKRKFAAKGMLTEHWPYYEPMTRHADVVKSFDAPLTKLRVRKMRYVPDDTHIFHDQGPADEGAADDVDDDDLKLFELKQRLRPPKAEAPDAVPCRACNAEDGAYNVFEACDTEGLDLAHKLSAIAGLEIDKLDNLPKQICFNCLKELETAFSFRRKCQDADKEHRANALRVANSNNADTADIKLEQKDADITTADEDRYDHDYDECPSDVEIKSDLFKAERKPPIEKEKLKKPPLTRRKGRKPKKERYEYTKMCEICGKHTGNLAGHLDVHATEKSYSCDVCDKKFKFKSGLSIHKAVHDPVPKKTCEVCGKTFHILAQYRRHFAYHANERKYSCDTCGKRFNTLDILKVHMRMHTDERPFGCQECGKTFRTAGCVSRHKRIVHKKIAKATNS